MSTPVASSADVLAVLRRQRDGCMRDLQRLRATRQGIDRAVRSKRAQLEVMNEIIRKIIPHGIDP